MTTKASFISSYIINSEFKNTSVLNGIIDAFHNQRKYAFIDLISATATSFYPDATPNNSLDRTAKFWESLPEPNQSITYQFSKALIYITSLSMQSNIKGNGDYPKQFAVYGSLDNSTWKEIAREEENRYFTYHGQIVNFPVEHEYYSYIKLEHTGTNERGDDHFCFENIEFYGTYMRILHIPTNRRCSKSNDFAYYYLIIIASN